MFPSPRKWKILNEKTNENINIEKGFQEEIQEITELRDEYENLKSSNTTERCLTPFIVDE